MRNLLLVFCALLASVSVQAQTSTTAADAHSPEVVLRFVRGNDMFFIPYAGNGTALDYLCDYVRSYGAMDEGAIKVDGYFRSDTPRHSAAICSNRVKSELIRLAGAKEEDFTTHNYIGRAYQQKNDVVVVTLPAPKVVEQPAPQPEPEPQPQPEPVQEEPQVVEQPAPAPEPEVAPVVLPEKNRFSLRTNLLYWVGGVPNLGFEWNASHTVGIVVNGGYGPLASNSWKHNWGGWFVAPEVRFYLGAPKRWFVGAEFLAGGFNIKPKDKGYQGTMLAGGVVAGYKMPISRSWAMDFTLGAGYGQFKYDTYERVGDYNVYLGRDLKKNTFMPIQAGVSLIWKIK